MNGSPPECWLGEKIEESNPFSFDGSYSVRPERGECYKPRTNMELMHVKDVFYTTHARKETKNGQGSRNEPGRGREHV